MASQHSMKTLIEQFTETISSTALVLADGDVGSITAEDVAAADVCIIQVLSGQLRFSTDGSTPTTTDGWLLSPADGRVPVVGQHLIKALQFIRDGSTDAIANVGLYNW